MKTKLILFTSNQLSFVDFTPSLILNEEEILYFTEMRMGTLTISDGDQKFEIPLENMVQTVFWFYKSIISVENSEAIQWALFNKEDEHIQILSVENTVSIRKINNSKIIEEIIIEKSAYIISTHELCCSFWTYLKLIFKTDLMHTYELTFKAAEITKRYLSAL